MPLKSINNPINPLEKTTKNKDFADPVLDILAKYGLSETKQSILKKIISNQKSKNVIFGELMAKFIKKEINTQELIDEIQKTFGLSLKKTKTIVKEIKQHIIAPTTTFSQKNKTQTKQGEEKDSYREIIE